MDPALSAAVEAADKAWEIKKSRFNRIVFIRNFIFSEQKINVFFGEIKPLQFQNFGEIV